MGILLGADQVTTPARRAVGLLAGSTKPAPAQVVSCGLDLDRYRSHVRPADLVTPATGPADLFVMPGTAELRRLAATPTTFEQLYPCLIGDRRPAEVERAAALVLAS